MDNRTKLIFGGTGLFVLGGVLGRVTRRKQKDILQNYGNIRIDRSTNEGPGLFLELTVPVSQLSGQKQVTFGVINESYISHE